MRVVSLIFILVFLSLCIFSGHAAVIEGLYKASVKIDNQSTRQQKRAARNALEQVLVKISGSRQLLKDGEVNRYLSRADDFLLSYQFERRADELFYNAEFDVDKVESIIRNTGFPLWGKHRPQTLIWLAVEDQPTGQRKLIADSSIQPLVVGAREAAKTRGIEVSFPVLDLTDIQQVSVYDVWSSFSQSLVSASERYGMEYMLSARMYFRSQEDVALIQKTEFDAPLEPLAGDVWVIDWMLTRAGTFESGVVTSLSQPNAIQNLVESLADSLSSTYAINAVANPKQEKYTMVTIGNIDNLSAYVDILDFLNGLSMVVSASLVEQQSDKATFQLELFGAKENLDQAFGLERRLQRPLDTFGQPMLNEPLRWKP